MLLHLVGASTWHCTLGKLLAWGLPECLQDLLAPPSHIPHSPNPQTFCHLSPTANIWRMIVQILKRCCCNYLIFGRRRPKNELWEDFSFLQSLTGEFTPKSKYLIIDICPPLRGLELMRDTRKTLYIAWCTQIHLCVHEEFQANYSLMSSREESPVSSIWEKATFRPGRLMTQLGWKICPMGLSQILLSFVQLLSSSWVKF